MKDSGRPARIGLGEVADQLVIALDDLAIRSDDQKTLTPPLGGQPGNPEGQAKDCIHVVPAGSILDRGHRLVDVFVRCSLQRAQRIFRKDDQAAPGGSGPPQETHDLVAICTEFFLAGLLHDPHRDSPSGSSGR